MKKWTLDQTAMSVPGRAGSYPESAADAGVTIADAIEIGAATEATSESANRCRYLK